MDEVEEKYAQLAVGPDVEEDALGLMPLQNVAVGAMPVAVTIELTNWPEAGEVNIPDQSSCAIRVKSRPAFTPHTGYEVLYTGSGHIDELN